MSGSFRTLARALAILPAAERDVAEAVGVRLPVVVVWLRALRQLRAVHCQRVVQRTPLLVDRIYALGDGVNAPSPHDALRGPKPAKPRGHVLNFALLWRALEVPATTHEIADQTGIDKRSVCKMVAELRDVGLVHIASWSPAGQNWAPSWVRGQGVNAPRPRRLSREVVNLRYYARSRRRISMQPLQQVMTSIGREAA